MHDWTLLSIFFEWEAGQVTLSFKSHAGDRTLVARSVADLHVPQLKKWGPSVSVNEVKGPVATGNGLQEIAIEMQSGDVIKIIATSFQMPQA
jgi:hypothetical protein